MYPLYFLGHGSPLTTCGINTYTKLWKSIGCLHPKPRGIICISAHWQTDDWKVSAHPNPKIIYDFSGFPPELYAIHYPLVSSEALAEELHAQEELKLDREAQIDHGTWTIIRHMYPDGGIPLVQISLSRKAQLKEHFNFGVKIAGLAQKGYLIIGSGNIVHNLWEMHPQGSLSFDWAEASEAYLIQAILAKNYTTLTAFETFPEYVQRGMPTVEHYLPLLVLLGMHSGQKNGVIELLGSGFQHGSISMASFSMQCT